METDGYMELEFNGKYFFVEVDVKVVNDQYKKYYSTWDTYTEKGELIARLSGNYSESKARDPMFIEEMMDSLFKVIRARIFLHEMEVIDEKELSDEQYEDFLRYMHDETC